MMRGVTTKLEASLETPFTVTATPAGPAAKSLGISAVMLLSLQAFAATAKPPKVSVLLP